MNKAWDDFEEAIKILKSYADLENSTPFYFENGVLVVSSVDPSKVPDEKINRLKTLGFEINKELGAFVSCDFEL